MKDTFIRVGIAVAIAWTLLGASIAYAGTPADITYIETALEPAVNSIAAAFGFTGPATVNSAGGYTYNPSHEGMNATYSDAQGDTLTIEYCENGAHVVTDTKVCSSAPNSCGMVGTGFATTFVSAEAQASSYSVPCNAQTPSNALCPANDQNSQNSQTGMTGGNGTSAAGGVSCPAGDLDEYGTCVATCDVGYVQQGEICAFSQCPTGWKRQLDANGNPACVQSSCNAGNVCVNGNVYSENADCVISTSAIQSCSNGCSDGACSPPPSPVIGSWLVTPVLLQSGQTTSVTWQTQNVVSCTISGSNGDGTASSNDAASPGAWTGVSGTETSSPITGQTIYTITCQGAAGAATSTVTKSTTVNIAPNYNEE